MYSHSLRPFFKLRWKSTPVTTLWSWVFCVLPQQFPAIQLPPLDVPNTMCTYTKHHPTHEFSSPPPGNRHKCLVRLRPNRAGGQAEVSKKGFDHQGVLSRQGRLVTVLNGDFFRCQAKANRGRMRTSLPCVQVRTSTAKSIRCRMWIARLQLYGGIPHEPFKSPSRTVALIVSHTDGSPPSAELA